MGTILKQFTNHVGLDLKSSDITRRQEFASDMLNAQYRKNGNITKREGYRGFSESDGGQGLAVYNRINPSSGVREEILLAIDDNLKKLTEATVTVNYTGAEVSCLFELFFDSVSGEYRVQITEGTTLVLDYGLGSGIDEISPIDLTDLKTQIDAIANFSATIVGETTVPAAFLDLKRGQDLTAGDVVMTARHWVEVNSPSAQVFPGNVTYKNDDMFENTSWVQLNNNIYFGNGYDEIIKFDGQQAYRAGMPQGGLPIPSVGGAGAITGTYDYIVVYAQFDANGNIIEGISSSASSSVTPAAQSVDVTIPNILETSGFNTGCAIVNGIQAGVTTITVDNGSGGGHTMQIGDTAYFYDGVSAGYVEREITNITGTSITIAGAAVNVADNEVISNNLRIGLYRTLNGGTVHYLVEEYANNSFVATQIVNDNKVDSALGIQYITPLVPHGLPPKGRYVSSYNNQMFIAGNLDNPNFAFWSSTEHPEYFDSSLLNLRLQSPNGDKITGLKQSNEVMAIFEDKAIHIISGDIPSLNIRVETITKDVGCVSHHSIQEVRGRLYFLSDRGVYSTVSGQLPIEMSTFIEPLFDQSSIIDDDLRYILRRSIAVNDRDKEQYVLFIPAESLLGSDKYANNNSIVLVQDYFRAAWLKWDNMNMASGAVIYNNNLTFSEKRNSVFSGSVEHYLYSVSNRGDSWDFQDNTDPIDFNYKSAWYHLGEPSVFKKWIRWKLTGTQETEFNSFMLDVDIEKDFLEDFVVGSFSVDFGSGVAGYGVSEYGLAPYGDVVDPNRKHKIGPIKSKSIRVVLKNSENLENVNITGWELQLSDVYKREIKE